MGGGKVGHPLGIVVGVGVGASVGAGAGGMSSPMQPNRVSTNIEAPAPQGVFILPDRQQSNDQKYNIDVPTKSSYPGSTPDCSYKTECDDCQNGNQLCSQKLVNPENQNICPQVPVGAYLKPCSTGTTTTPGSYMGNTTPGSYMGPTTPYIDSTNTNIPYTGSNIYMKNLQNINSNIYMK